MGAPGGDALHGNRVADMQCTRFPPVLFQIERVAKFHCPICDGASSVPDVHEKKKRRSGFTQAMLVTIPASFTFRSPS